MAKRPFAAQRWLKLWQRKQLFGRALFWVIVMRVGLWIKPLQALQVLVTRYGRGNYLEPQSFSSDATAIVPLQVLAGEQWREIEALSWATTQAARLVPQATCLTQALALQLLLAQRGYSSCLWLGVMKNAGKFQAHAWIEIAQRVVIGGQNRDNWTPLTSWDFQVSSHRN